MWVNSPLPVDIADGPHPGRRPHVLVDLEEAGARIEPEDVQAEGGEGGPPTRGHEEALTGDLAAVGHLQGQRRAVLAGTGDGVAGAHLDPLCGRSTPAIISEASGSSIGTRRGVPSTTVTREPKRANTWASSRPMAPPPRTRSESGTSSVLMASRFVQYGSSFSPGSAG